MKLGTIIKTAREARGLSLVALGKRAKMSPATLSRIENNDKTRVPSTEMLARLARHLDLSPDVVFPAAGRLPPDLARWLLVTPGAIGAVREKMGAAA